MKKPLISTKLKFSISSRVVVLSAFLVLLVGFLVVGLADRSVSQPSITRPSGTTAHRAKEVIDNELYTQLELADIENYAATSANNFVVTSGTVVGIKLTPFYQLVLGDSKGSYVVVTFARAFTDVFAQPFSTLKIGDVVEVMGRADVTQGVLVSSPGGVTIETEGVNLAHAPSFGIISLTGTGITKIE